MKEVKVGRLVSFPHRPAAFATKSAPCQPLPQRLARPLARNGITMTPTKPKTTKQLRAEAYRKKAYTKAARNTIEATLAIADELDLTPSNTIKLFKAVHAVLVEAIETNNINDPIIDGAIAEALRRNAR